MIRVGSYISLWERILKQKWSHKGFRKVRIITTCAVWLDELSGGLEPDVIGEGSRDCPAWREWWDLKMLRNMLLRNIWRPLLPAVSVCEDSQSGCGNDVVRNGPQISEYTSIPDFHLSHSCDPGLVSCCQDDFAWTTSGYRASSEEDGFRSLSEVGSKSEEDLGVERMRWQALIYYRPHGVGVSPIRKSILNSSFYGNTSGLLKPWSSWTTTIPEL